jgi:hypothetical protein
MDWNTILNWKLLKGSHKFPGPDGGTCINEAAIVAAGFKYKKVDSAHDCPPCFSHTIAAYAIALNDRMPDALRQELLMPFVTRMAGTADIKEAEQRRTEYISVQTVKRILPIALRAMKLAAHAKRCEAVETVEEARAAAAAAATATTYAAATYAADDAAAYAADAADAAAYAADAADAAAYAADAADAAAYAASAVDVAAYAAFAASEAPANTRDVFAITVAILDEAIKLGNQAKPIETALVVERMEAIRQRALADRG